MTTIAIAGDYRRTDQRTNVLENPFWITSGLVSNLTCTGAAALLFSFPTAGQKILVHEVVAQNVALGVGGTVVDIGSGTLATDAVTTGGVLTIVDLDEYILQGDYVVTANTCWGSTTANTSDWLTAKAAQTYAAPRVITGAASTVPCVYATVGASFSAGTFRLHMLITILPGT